MTPAQEAIWAQVNDMLREHFDAAVITVMSEIDPDENHQAVRSCWHGGLFLARGLTEQQRDRLRQAAQTEPSTPQDE
jgi:DNA-binding NarL/FixJ family response regulator